MSNVTIKWALISANKREQEIERHKCVTSCFGTNSKHRTVHFCCDLNVEENDEIDPWCLDFIETIGLDLNANATGKHFECIRTGSHYV